MIPFPFSREEIFAVLGILVSIIRYSTYLRAIYLGQARPHVFSWFNWGVVVGIGAYAQMQLGGGPSVWVLTLVSVTCLFISIIALFHGEKNITWSDWATFIGALMTIVVWQTTSSPFMAIICIIAIDGLSYWPTIRKSWLDPWGEPPKSHFWAGMRYFLALFAVPDATVAKLLYPAFLMIADWSFVIYIIWRQRILTAQKIMA